MLRRELGNSIQSNTGSVVLAWLGGRFALDLVQTTLMSLSNPCQSPNVLGIDGDRFLDSLHSGVETLESLVVVLLSSCHVLQPGVHSLQRLVVKPAHFLESALDPIETIHIFRLAPKLTFGGPESSYLAFPDFATTGADSIRRIAPSFSSVST